MSVLVVAEKPSVGVSLANVLGAKDRRQGYYEGNGYIVSWCIGHLVGLADADKYDARYGRWRREDLPIIPGDWKYAVFQNKKGHFNVLKGLMNRKDVESIVCATDAGREGELIFRFVYQMAGCKKPFARLWISSMEEGAIRRGFEDLRPAKDFEPLYDSALCRAKADWIVGINATRLYTTLYNRTLNVGRVQSPTLAMIVDRQAAIGNFVKEKYYMARLEIGGIEAVSGHIKERDMAEQIKADCQGGQAVCVSVKKERKSVAPPKLFDLTALQREANKLHGFTAKETLDAAQKLYEGKLITYPRTDSRYLASDMEQSLAAIALGANALIGAAAAMLIKTAQVINDKKITDHHAIIPTAGIANVSASGLDDTERKILLLIAARFVCALGEKHEYDSTAATFDCGGHSFAARGKMVVSNGWREVDDWFRQPLKLQEPETEDDFESGALPQIAEGKVFDNASASVTEHFTQPPKPYTEDTLLSAMERAGADATNADAERSGLGTPATRAAVIEKLVKGGYIERKNRQLAPTDEGIRLVGILPDALRSPLLTAEWENGLALIAKGEESPEAFMGRVERMVKEIVANAAKAV